MDVTQSDVIQDDAGLEVGEWATIRHPWGFFFLSPLSTTPGIAMQYTQSNRLSNKIIKGYNQANTISQSLREGVTHLKASEPCGLSGWEPNHPL